MKVEINSTCKMRNGDTVAIETIDYRIKDRLIVGGRCKENGVHYWFEAENGKNWSWLFNRGRVDFEDYDIIEKL